MGSIIRNFEDVNKLARHKWTKEDALKAIGHMEKGYAELQNVVPEMEKATARAYELTGALDKFIREKMSLPEEEFQKEKLEVEKYSNAILDELKKIRFLVWRI